MKTPKEIYLLQKGSQLLGTWSETPQIEISGGWYSAEYKYIRADLVEQKPALDDYLKATPADRRKMSMTEILDKEHKPAEWSEDIKNWKNIVYYVLKEWNGIGQYLDNPELDEIAKELQKRYGSVNPISTPQWSEEGKMHLNNAILAAEKEWGAESCTAKFLKSLRPSWKPSDEQMKALKEAVDEHWEADGLHPLYTLYDYLEKL